MRKLTAEPPSLSYVPGERTDDIEAAASGTTQWSTERNSKGALPGISKLGPMALRLATLLLSSLLVNPRFALIEMDDIRGHHHLAPLVDKKLSIDH